MSIGLVVLFPLVFVSNVFVDPATMPAWLGAIARANPVSHLAGAPRDLRQGTASAGQVVGVLAVAAVITVVFAPLTAWLYRRRT